MATIRNLTIDQGSTFSVSITLTDLLDNPLDLTGYEIRAQLRKSYGSNTFTAFDASAGDNPEDGVITLELTAEQTGALRPGRYVYDVEIELDEDVTRVVEGIITVTPEVTKMSLNVKVSTMPRRALEVQVTEPPKINTQLSKVSLELVNLEELKNVDTPDLENGYTLIWNELTQQWITQRIEAVAGNIDGGTY